MIILSASRQASSYCCCCDGRRSMILHITRHHSSKSRSIAASHEALDFFSYISLSAEAAAKVPFRPARQAVRYACRASPIFERLGPMRQLGRGDERASARPFSPAIDVIFHDFLRLPRRLPSASLSFFKGLAYKLHADDYYLLHALARSIAPQYESRRCA